MTAFNDGDVVKLKSGGPNMTVSFTREDGQVWCVWFVGTKKNEAEFPEKSLMKYEAPAPLRAKSDFT